MDSGWLPRKACSFGKEAKGAKDRTRGPEPVDTHPARLHTQPFSQPSPPIPGGLHSLADHPKSVPFPPEVRPMDHQLWPWTWVSDPVPRPGTKPHYVPSWCLPRVWEPIFQKDLRPGRAQGPRSHRGLELELNEGGSGLGGSYPLHQELGKQRPGEETGGLTWGPRACAQQE